MEKNIPSYHHLSFPHSSPLRVFQGMFPVSFVQVKEVIIEKRGYVKKKKNNSTKNKASLTVCKSFFLICSVFHYLCSDRDEEVVLSAEMPLVKEVTTTLREWGSIWKQLFVV